MTNPQSINNFMYCIYCGFWVEENELVCEDCQKEGWDEDKERQHDEWEKEYKPPTERQKLRMMRKFTRTMKKPLWKLAFNKIKSWQRIMSLTK